jgi:signal transduction histidine kinase
MRVSKAALPTKAFSPDVVCQPSAGVSEHSLPRFYQLWLNQTQRLLPTLWLGLRGVAANPSKSCILYSQRQNRLPADGYAASGDGASSRSQPEGDSPEGALSRVWDGPLPTGHLCELPAPGLGYSYAYALPTAEPAPLQKGQHNAAQREDAPGASIDAVVIYSAQPLASAQRQCLVDQLDLLQDYVRMEVAQTSKQAEVKQLEHVLRQAQHQLRNPIALVQMYAALLSATLPEGELQSHAGQITEAANELSQHLKALSQQRRAEPLLVQQQDLRAIWADCVRAVQPWLTEKQITVCQPETAAIAPVDGWQIKQVFDNLLTNAIHFSPVGGTIYCHWQMFRHEILVEVWDEGKGLSEADAQNLFQPFYTRRAGGTGLGLAIAQKIVLDHRGRLWASNHPDKGAKFCFTLPRQTFASS